MTPHGFLRAAATKNARSNQDDRRKKYQVVTFMGDNKAKVNGYINDRTWSSGVETWIDNAFPRDMPFEAIYTDSKAAGGRAVPDAHRSEQGGYPIFDLNVST